VKKLKTSGKTTTKMAISVTAKAISSSEGKKPILKYLIFGEFLDEEP